MEQTRPIPMARFSRALIPAGALAALISGGALAAFSAARGLPFWMPFNATTQAFYGPEVASVTALDMAHTGLGLAIHVASAFFWAAVALLVIRRIRRGGARQAWITGLGTAVMALLIDYGLLPRRLSPGWHLVLPWTGVILGFAALGTGISLGLGAAHRPAAATAAPRRRAEPVPPGPDVAVAESGPQALRHPDGQLIDQRQQRIDPANFVTEDPNHNTGKPRSGGPVRQDETPHG